MILHYLVGHSFSHIRERIKEDGVFHGIIGWHMVFAGVFFVVHRFLFSPVIVFGLSCPLRELCNDDDCGMQCFTLDMHECPNEAGWEAFGVE